MANLQIPKIITLAVHRCLSGNSYISSVMTIIVKQASTQELTVLLNLVSLMVVSSLN